MAGKPKPIPMPVELVLTHPAMFYCPGATYRAVAVIAMAFWHAQCPPEPLDDVALQNLARVPPSHWNGSRAAIKAILADVLPQLAHAYADAKMRKAHVKAFFANASARGKKPRQKPQDPKTAENKIPPASRAPLVTPAHARLFPNDGRSHLSPQELAVIGKLEQNPVARLVDE